ncbi:hypothetical protein GCM10023088_81140 [Actinomadura verrucosospora]
MGGGPGGGAAPVGDDDLAARQGQLAGAGRADDPGAQHHDPRHRPSRLPFVKPNDSESKRATRALSTRGRLRIQGVSARWDGVPGEA